jgi:HEAT repeat protein
MPRSIFTSLIAVLAVSLHAANAPALTTLTYSGDQTAIESIDRDINAAGSDAQKLAAIEKQLFEALRHKDATFASRQAICQRLGLVLAQSPGKASADAYKPLGTMLADERDSDLARLALDPAPGEVVDGLFVSALKKATGRTRVGIIDSIGRRRVATAVDGLVPLLKNSDRSTAAAAASALGAIANPAAVAALSAFSEPSDPAIAKAKLAAAARTKSVPLLLELERNPVHRLAAFRLLLDLEPANAVSRIADTLTGSDWTRKQVALESLLASRAPNLVPTLTSKLSSWDSPTQAAVIAALARRAEPAALPAIITAASHRDAEVRRAAIEAIGNFSGTRDTTALLAKIAADSESDNAKLARQTLARLNGTEVNATILSGAERGEPKLRAAYLEQLGLRNMTEGVPLLLKCRADPETPIRLAAVGALGEIATPAEQRTLIDWVLGATDEAEQSRALRSVVNVVQRDQSKERGREFREAIEKAPADACLRLMPALQRIGGAASADCAARLALRDDQKIADAAVAALTRWTDRVALSALATVAQKAALPAIRAAALKGAMSYFEKSREVWNADFTNVVGGLLAGTKDAEPRKRLVALLNRANDKPALALAEKLKTDPAVGVAAGEAAEIIKSNLAGAPTLRVSDNAMNAKNMIDGRTGTRWNVETNGEEWVEIEFKAARPVHRITLDQTGRAAEFPEHYDVFVTDDQKNPGPPRASGQGQRTRTVIDLPAGTRGRYVIIKNTKARAESQWAVCELFVD